MGRALLTLAAALVFAAPAGAYTRSDKLEHVLSVFANGRAWPVECATPDEAAELGLDDWSFAFTEMKQHYVMMRGDLCPAAENAADESIPPLERSIAILALVHEAYHVRAWTWRHDEARVECRAIQHFKIGAQLLGASEDQAQELLPFALMWHYFIARPEWLYYDPNCRVPHW